MTTDEAKAQLAKWLGTVREDGARKDEAVAAVRALAKELGNPAPLHDRLVAERDATDDDAYWSVLDAMLEAVPPTSDWIPLADGFRPGQETVMARAAALGAVFQQFDYERAIAEDPESRALLREAARHRWIALARLALSDAEREAIEQEPGEWSEASRDALGWRAEAFGVLAWAVGLRAEIPPYDEEFDEESLLDLYEDILEGRAEPKLRSWDEIRAAANEARTRYGDAKDALSRERRHATVWLCGGRYDWDDVPTDGSAIP